MDDLLSEKEQLAQFRSWWKEFGAYVIGGVVVMAIAMYGWNRYQSAELQAQLEASEAYESLVVLVSEGNLDEAELIANTIATDYSGTTYVGQAGLAMARLYMDKNRDQDAADALLAIVDGKSDDGLQHIARLRLARIYLYQDKAEEVIQMLAGQDHEAFAAAYGEVRGDAYTALGQIAEAQEAYQAVLLDPLSQGTVDQQLVQWKSLDLPEPESMTEVESDSESESENAEESE